MLHNLLSEMYDGKCNASYQVGTGMMMLLRIQVVCKQYTSHMPRELRVQKLYHVIRIVLYCIKPADEAGPAPECDRPQHWWCADYGRPWNSKVSGGEQHGAA